MIDEHGADMVVAESRIRYLGSAAFDDELDFELRVARLGGTALGTLIDASVREQPVVQPHFHIHRMASAHPVDCSFDLPPFGIFTQSFRVMRAAHLCHRVLDAARSIDRRRRRVRTRTA